jgi:hypothetical protein
MLSVYKEKILKEIERVPEDNIPKLFRIIHLLATEIRRTQLFNEQGI